MKRPPRADRLSNPTGTPDEWAVSAALEPLDDVAARLEAEWGVGVLERLVAPSTAARFASARKRLDDAIDSGDWQEVSRRSEVLIRGWKALDSEARAAGHEPADPGRFWLVRGDDGRGFVFVQDERDVQIAAKKFPDHQAWSMAEVTRALSARSASIASVADLAKEMFPGAVLTDVRRPKKPLNDELPF